MSDLLTITHPKTPLWDWREIKADLKIEHEYPTDREVLDLGLLSSCKVATDGESFWVIIVGLLWAGQRLGRVANDLEATETHGLKYGDHIVFRPYHVRKIGSLSDAHESVSTPE